MDRNRGAKRNKPKPESSADLSGDVLGMSGLPPILPTPTLKQLKPLDYRPVPVISPSGIPVPPFAAPKHEGSCHVMIPGPANLVV